MDIIKVLIVDDQQMIHKGIEAMFRDVREIKLIGFAYNASEALDLIAKKSPDVLVLDVEMPDTNGLVLTREIVREFPITRIIILSAFEKKTYVAEALSAGASGYLSKSAIIEDLSWAIQLVHRGYSAFQTNLLQQATIDRELLLEQSQSKITLLEEDLYRQKIKLAKQPLIRRNAIKSLFLPLVYLRKNRWIVKLERKLESIISRRIERVLKYCDRFWQKN